MSDRPLLTETTFHVRYAETDMMQIVHHSVYFVYFEEGRSELSRRGGAPYRTLEETGYSLALSDAQARYIAPARYDDLITVRTWIDTIKSRSVTFAYEVVHAETGQVLVTGSTRHICIDREGQVRRIPEEWIAPLREKAGL